MQTSIWAQRNQPFRIEERLTPAGYFHIAEEAGSPEGIVANEDLGLLASLDIDEQDAAMRGFAVIVEHGAGGEEEVLVIVEVFLVGLLMSVADMGMAVLVPGNDGEGNEKRGSGI